MPAIRYVLAIAILTTATLSSAAAQASAWKVTGDTTRAPAGCSAHAAIRAIDRWFAAFNAADSAGLASALAYPFMVSTGSRWVANDIHRRFDDDIGALVDYARERRRYQERLTLDSVQFGGWQGPRLAFMPFHARSATDLGPQPVPGWGRAQYWCHQGIKALAMARDPWRPGAGHGAAHADTSVAGVRITFLANEGVMLSAGSDKVLIDALYMAYGTYAVPDQETQARLALGKQPFDGVDVILVTHYHGDHFAPEPVARHLRSNAAATLVTSRQVIDSLRAGTSLTGIGADRLLSRTTPRGTRRREAINGITIELLGIPHGSRRHRRVEHLGFIVDVGGRRVLHVGDTDITEETYAPLRLDTTRVDVALIPYWALLDDDSRRVITRYIRPRHVVAIHVEAGVEAGRRMARQVESLLPGVATFYRSLESRSW